MKQGQLSFDAFERIEAGARESLAPGAVVLRGFASNAATELLRDIALVSAAAPFRHLITPGGFRMSVAMTNCGALGWTSNERGYRYSDVDPESGARWPAMPASFLQLAKSAASSAGFEDFAPDACLVNRYEPGTRLTLHQDKNERDYTAPIVSVSLGIPAVFVFGGDTRSERPARMRLIHGDVAVWGGEARLKFHGVLPLAHEVHPTVGAFRLNLTFRKAR